MGRRVWSRSLALCAAAFAVSGCLGRASARHERGARDPSRMAAGSGGSAGFGFFVFSDSHVSSAINTYFAAALNQMSTLAKAAPVPTIAAFSLGDHTLLGTSAEWAQHMALATPTLDPTATGFGSRLPRYLAAIGNHDITDGKGWYASWNGAFPGQQGLGTNSRTDGIYFSASHGNAFMGTPFRIRLP